MKNDKPPIKFHVTIKYKIFMYSYCGLVIVPMEIDEETMMCDLSTISKTGFPPDALPAILNNIDYFSIKIG